MKFFNRPVDLLLDLLPVILALVFTTLILMVAKAPAGEAYGNILAGATENPAKISSVLMAWVPLALCSAGLLVTFTAGLWNIGVEGQIAAGAILVTWVARNVALTPLILIPTLLLAGMLGGALWGLLCGVLKTYGRVHEIFGGVGLNFVAAAATNFLIFGPWNSRFPSSLRCRILCLYQYGLDFGQPRKTRYFVGVKVEVENLSASEVDLLG